MIAPPVAGRQFRAMRVLLFLGGAAVLFLGWEAHRILPRDEALGFLHGALVLGGGLLICGLFSLKMKWHGIIGGGVLALLGVARGLGNLPALAAWLGSDRERGPAPLLELGVTAVCLLVLLRVLGALYRERVRRMLEQEP